MNKRYLSWTDVESQVAELCRQITQDNWRPDYVIGLTRGGLLPATMISHWFDVPMHALHVSLRDGDNNDCESNLWMAEDAFGYVPAVHDTGSDSVAGRVDPDSRKQLLIVDDINDSGATMQWIHSDWQSGCLPADQRWDEIWNFSVRHAVLVNNAASAFTDIDYAAQVIDKRERPEWIVFPWEEWWTRR